MAYVLEKITPTDIETIFANADEAKRSHLRMRGGHFVTGIDSVWAIDRKRNMYLLCAPTIEARSSFAYFYFYFNSVTYGFRIDKSKQKAIQLDDIPPNSVFAEFKKEVLEAFSVHRLCGFPDQEAPFLPTFEELKE